MTSGLKTPSSYYIELITTQNRINYILDKKNLTQDDRDYLKVLGTLVYDYEQQHEQIPMLRGVELLKALLEESNLQPKDLVPICKSESEALDILNNKRQMTEEEIEGFASFFRMNPSYFK
ncbi:helix-turn-helix domain-containing protein [Fischerella thermalis]|uniref:helix-turn-helix domain-containing protein n=1 Tax=Fischerella thermalis TaxID=372787 RepID=UPI000C7FA5C5|nr:transcriptional regulator [Fischerella thermalis]PLZ55396.1 transcriptional regulator [Fischerella thermalis WC439]PLZ59973.1 transcriptional regulator [Fischerella thermalis WC442]PLZ83072.1 transcriptional regulator [Fischerella thermalis WC213]